MANKRKLKIIPDKLFHKMWKKATCGCSKKEYISYFLNVQSEGYIDFNSKYEIHFEEAAEMLSNIYDATLMSFDELLKKTGKRKCEIRDIFCIPQRTFEDWCSGKNKVNQTIKLMILRQFHLINLGKYIRLQSDIDYKDSYPKIYKKSAAKKEKSIAPTEQEDVSSYNVSNWTPSNTTEEKETKYDMMDDDEFNKMLENISPSAREKAKEKERINNAANVAKILRETSYLDNVIHRK